MPWTHLPPHRPGWYWHVGPHAGAPDEIEEGAEAAPKVVFVTHDGETVVLRLEA